MMYERMLNKQETPSFADMLAYSGESADLWRELDAFLEETYILTKLIRFPYGNSYGWSIKYSQKSRHICDTYAEKGAFCAHFQISEQAFNGVDDLTAYAKQLYENRYPCGSGGWLTFRVLEPAHLADLKKLLLAKVKPQKAKN